MTRQTATLALCTAVGATSMPIQNVQAGTMVNVAGGALVAVALAQYFEYRRAHHLDPVVQVLGRLNDGMNALFEHMIGFRASVRGRMTQIADYAQRAGTTRDDAILQVGNELIDTVNDMIGRTNTLSEGLHQLEEGAIDSTDVIRNILQSEHPAALHDI